MFKKWDFIIIVSLLILSFLPELFFISSSSGKGHENYAEISLDGKIYQTINLSTHKGIDSIDIKTESGYNIIEINEHSIRIIDADCPDRICVNDGAINAPGQLLVCLPHKLMIEIKNDDPAETADIIPAH